ncbi:MAG: hypothetical protein ABIK99_06715 [candidate division WOR-3 bacterium]
MKILRGLLFLISIGFLLAANGEILIWDFFEENFGGINPSWIQCKTGRGTIGLRTEWTRIPYAYSVHGKTSLYMSAYDETSFAYVKREFPTLSSNEYLVEFYFWIDTSYSEIRNLRLYEPRKGDTLAHIVLTLAYAFDSIGKKYWRLYVQDKFNIDSSLTLRESIDFWYKFQIHQLPTGTVLLWINGDSIKTSFTSISDTLQPDSFRFGIVEGSKGSGFWDDFIITTPPSGSHPGIYFKPRDIPALREKRGDNDTIPLGISAGSLWRRREGWASRWDNESISIFEDDTMPSSEYTFHWPYPQPPFDSTSDRIWHFYEMALGKRLELVALVSLLNSDTKLFETLRVSLRSISSWEQWTNRFTTAYSNLYLPFLVRGLASSYDLIFSYLNNYEKMAIQNALLVHGIGQLYQGLEFYNDYGYWGTTVSTIYLAD